MIYRNVGAVMVFLLSCSGAMAKCPYLSKLNLNGAQKCPYFAWIEKRLKEVEEKVDRLAKKKQTIKPNRRLKVWRGSFKTAASIIYYKNLLSNKVV